MFFRKRMQENRFPFHAIFYHAKKAPESRKPFKQLGYKDSNLEMTESESVALPFGDSPIIKSDMKFLNWATRIRTLK